MEARGHNPTAEERVRRKAKGFTPRATGRVHQKTGGHWLQDVRRTAEAAKHVKNMLKKIPSVLMVEECPDIARVADAFPDLWALSEASRKVLLDLPGIGEKRLLIIQEALAKRNVVVRWRA